MITVTDNGTSISEEHLPKLFTSFFTTRHDGEGTGIGLATAFGIIVEMNGEIRAESEYGSFTRFIISLPGV
jgi:signal transduction histidine kinase